MSDDNLEAGKNGGVAAGAAKKAIIKLRGVRKVYKRDQQEIPVLEGIDLDIPEGSFEALMGPSGSGKTTLLNLIAGIDNVSAGTVEVAGTDLTRLSEGELATWRSRNIGFIFQFYNLLPVFTAFQNVELPLLLTNLSKAERKKRVETALRVVGLEDRMDHYPRQLSGGQEQRVAIARAIVTDPTILVADEPTGDLDRKSAEEILKLLDLLHRKFNKTIVMVTHDPAAAQSAEIIRRLDKGQLLADGAAGPFR
ncbi:MAG: transporter, ATP-binding protein [Myxococcales bacterium]|nr:transporter, ATP-binding protein [Myxococcales bacterium]